MGTSSGYCWTVGTSLDGQRATALERPPRQRCPAHASENSPGPCAPEWERCNLRSGKRCSEGSETKYLLISNSGPLQPSCLSRSKQKLSPLELCMFYFGETMLRTIARGSCFQTISLQKKALYKGIYFLNIRTWPRGQKISVLRTRCKFDGLGKMYVKCRQRNRKIFRSAVLCDNSILLSSLCMSSPQVVTVRSADSISGVLVHYGL